jgi:hypothetical protein
VGKKGHGLPFEVDIIKTSLENRRSHSTAKRYSRIHTAKEGRLALAQYGRIAKSVLR